MAEQFQTSFIPKKVVEQKGSHLSGSGILLTVSVVLLVLSLLSAGGVLLYTKYLDGALASKKETLQKQKAEFAPELIRDMARLDRKLEIGKSLLEDHVSVTGVFELLQELTLKTVRFTNLTYTQGKDGITLNLQGEGQSFTSVALQSDEFGESNFLSEAIFSNFQLNERGNVNFTVTAIVDPKVVSFIERKDRGGVGTIDETIDTATAPTVSSEEVVTPQGDAVIGG